MVESELELNPDLRVLIRADQMVEYKTCKEIMIACGEVGATDLIYATFEGKDEAIDEMINKKAELQIAPLIDVVFLLLIYFMVTASLIKRKRI